MLQWKVVAGDGEGKFYLSYSPFIMPSYLDHYSAAETGGKNTSAPVVSHIKTKLQIYQDPLPTID